MIYAASAIPQAFQAKGWELLETDRHHTLEQLLCSDSAAEIRPGKSYLTVPDRGVHRVVERVRQLILLARQSNYPHILHAGTLLPFEGFSLPTERVVLLVVPEQTRTYGLGGHIVAEYHAERELRELALPAFLAALSTLPSSAEFIPHSSEDGN
ncbi:hypothetical protein HYS48_02070 [Candidatus Woesearchaeota archaeon]|nr:hypothetical protein [Candidatus Woesearchaeota archaeon]